MTPTQQELEEFRQDLKENLRRDNEYEIKMRYDFDFALDELGGTEIIKDFKTLFQSLQKLDYDMEATDLLDLV